MPSYKFNPAILVSCPKMKDLAAAIDAYGRPADSEFGVLHDSVCDHSSLEATIFKAGGKKVRRLDQHGRLLEDELTTITQIPFKVWPAEKRLEVYAGNHSSVEAVATFMSLLELDFRATLVDIDLQQAIRQIPHAGKDFKIKQVKCLRHPYEDVGFGAYTPKFHDAADAVDFLTAEAESQPRSLTLSWKAPNGRASMQIATNGCMSISCKEKDKQYLMDVARNILLRCPAQEKPKSEQEG